MSTLPNPVDKLKAVVSTTEQPRTIENMIQSSIKELGRALPEHMNADKLARVALTCIRLNPELAKCTPESFLGSLFVLAQLGLSPGVAGQAYLIPFKNKRKVNNEWKEFKEVQALVGFKGLIALFYRNESSLSIDAKTVFANDFFSFEYGSDAKLIHKPFLKDRGKPIAYYALAKMKGGGCLFSVMSTEECFEHGKNHSKTFDRQAGKFYDSSPWAKEFDAMCRKTVIIQLAKMLPISIEMQKAISIDETSRDYRSGTADATDLAITTTWDRVDEKDEPTIAQGSVEGLKTALNPNDDGRMK